MPIATGLRQTLHSQDRSDLQGQDTFTSCMPALYAWWHSHLDYGVATMVNLLPCSLEPLWTSKKCKRGSNWQMSWKLLRQKGNNAMCSSGVNRGLFACGPSRVRAHLRPRRVRTGLWYALLLNMAEEPAIATRAPPRVCANSRNYQIY